MGQIEIVEFKVIVIVLCIVLGVLDAKPNQLLTGYFLLNEHRDLSILSCYYFKLAITVFMFQTCG